MQHSPCPFEDCNSSDAFNYDEDKQVGFCHSCHRGYPHKGMKIREEYKNDYPLKENRLTEVVSKTSYEGIRGLDADVAKLYKIQLQLNDKDKPVRYAFAYPETTKYRGYDEKTFWVKDKGTSILSLFGPDFNQGSSKKLYLTEGEFDAASLYQALGKSYPVKSLPSSSIGDKFIKVNYDYLNSFEQLIYAGELDQAGKKCADKLYSIFPAKFYYVPMSKHKDANDFLQAGDVNDLKWAALKPQRYSPENFFCSDQAVEDAIRKENPYEYTPTGHSKFDSICRGLVRGGLTFIKAPRGTGKTEIARFFECSLLKNSDVNIGLLHMEEQKSTTYRAMASYHLNKNVRTKDDARENEISEDDVIKAAKEISQGERTILFEMRSHDDPLDLLDHVRVLATVYNVSFIFIDHVQRLAYLSSSGIDGATSTLTTLASRMAQLCKELNIGVVFLSQVNDDGRTKYAASLEEEAIIVVKLERDFESEDEVERNTTRFIFDKNRPFSKLGDGGSIFYDIETTLLREEF